MHPIFGSRARLLGYFGLWIPLAALLGLVVDSTGTVTPMENACLTLPLALLLAFVCLSPWYACRAMPLGSTNIGKLLLSHLTAAFFAGLLGFAAARVLAMPLMETRVGIDQRLRSVMPLIATMAFLFYLLSVAIHYALLAVESSRQAQVFARDAELKALKAQVNPHFLFNSLNSISALVTTNPALAREMCIRLSDFLRLSLRMGDQLSIPLGEELALARVYLDVEQVRFGRRLTVVQEIAPACEDCDVPPLLVQPLIENAIKHGIATLVEGGQITLSGRRSRTGVRLVIENPFDPESPAPRTSGIGLVNVRNRLQARFGNAARLDVEASPGQYRVVLTIPCETRD